MMESVSIDRSVAWDVGPRTARVDWIINRH